MKDAGNQAMNAFPNPKRAILYVVCWKQFAEPHFPQNTNSISMSHTNV